MDSDAGVHVDMAGSDWGNVQNECGMKPSPVTAFVMDTGIGAARTQKAVSQCHHCMLIIPCSTERGKAQFARQQVQFGLGSRCRSAFASGLMDCAVIGGLANCTRQQNKNHLTRPQTAPGLVIFATLVCPNAAQKSCHE